MNIAARDVTPAHCTRTQHIELRLATVDDVSAIAQLISAWFPMTIWQDCLHFDAAKAAPYIARGIASGCQPFILALDRPKPAPPVTAAQAAAAEARAAQARVDRTSPGRLLAPTKNFPGPDSGRNTIQEPGALVGCISWHLDARFTEPIGVLDEVFVIDRLRRSDLGRRLIMMAMHISREEGAKVFNFPVASGMPAQVSLINMLTRHIGAEPVGVILRKVL